MQPGETASPTIRDVVLVTIDTLRADALGFAGNERVQTPSLDRLAAQSRVFERARAHNVMTLPSHANLLTGRYPWEHGVRDNAGFVLGDGWPTAATLLREAGFATAAVVGAFPLDARFGLDHGFDLYDDRYPLGSEEGLKLAERRGDEVVEIGLEWWRAHEGERRFLWLHLFDPHTPYEPTEPWATRFRSDPYFGEVSAVDHYLAPLLEAVTAEMAAPALLIITSDHGEALGEHGELTHGLFAYEATLRVPLLVWHPGVRAARIDEPAGHVDVLPTILAATGASGPDDLPGRDLLQGLPAERSHPFENLNPALNRGWAPLRGVVRSELKYIELPIPELYDLASDPREARNLHDQKPERVEALSDLLPEKSEWPPRRGTISAEEQRQLMALGYLTGDSATVDREFTAADDPKTLVEVDRKLQRFMELFGTGRLGEATSLARELVKEQPQMPSVHYHLGQVLLEQGRAQEALAAMEAGYEAGAVNGALVRQLALTLAETGQAERAVEVLRPHLEDDPDSYRVYGFVLSEADDPKQARTAVERSLALDSDNPLAYETLALVELRAERYADALAHAERALALSPDLSLAWNYKGLALYSLGQKEEAVNAWQEAVRRAPGDFDLLYNLAMVSGEIGRLDVAREALERFVAEAPPSRYGPDIARARRILQSLPESR